MNHNVSDLNCYNQYENEKSFAFYYYTLTLISAGMTPQEATAKSRCSFDAEKTVAGIRSRIGNEALYQEMKNGVNPNRFYNSLMELLITDPRLSPVDAREKRIRYVMTEAVIEGRIQPDEIALHDILFKQSIEDREAKESLDNLWHRADPDRVVQRLKRMYLERQTRGVCTSLTFQKKDPDDDDYWKRETDNGREPQNHPPALL